jgi:heme/copper-type cytochrome/quinol oxidase subunit 2
MGSTFIAGSLVISALTLDLTNNFDSRDISVSNDKLTGMYGEAYFAMSVVAVVVSIVMLMNVAKFYRKKMNRDIKMSGGGSTFSSSMRTYWYLLVASSILTLILGSFGIQTSVRNGKRDIRTKHADFEILAYGNVAVLGLAMGAFSYGLYMKSGDFNMTEVTKL